MDVSDVGRHSDLSSVLMSVMMVAMSISQTAAPIVAASKAASAASDFFAVIDAPKPSITGLKHPDVSAQDEIRFECVNFAYPSRAHVKVLDDLSVFLEPGKITAIVGASGSGKSTIVSLLERWYELEKPQTTLPKSCAEDTEEDNKPEPPSEPSAPCVELSGTIFVGKTKLPNIDLKWWRAQIGLVQQEPFIFNDTILKNVEYGLNGSPWENEDAPTKRKLVEQACKEAFADEFIHKLPLVISLSNSHFNLQCFSFREH